MNPLVSLDVTQWLKWLLVAIGVLQLVAEFLAKGDLSVPAIVTAVAGIVLFIINALQNRAARMKGLK